MANLKNIKKGDKVILRVFSGAFVTSKIVEMANEEKIGFTRDDKTRMIFSKKTGKQLSPIPKQERYASYIEPYDPDVEEAELNKKRKVKS